MKTDDDLAVRTGANSEVCWGNKSQSTNIFETSRASTYLESHHFGGKSCIFWCRLSLLPIGYIGV